MQKLVFFLEPSEDSWNVSLKSGNMCWNRFSVDEDAAFELLDVHYLKKSSREIKYGDTSNIKSKRNSKGKE